LTKIAQKIRKRVLVKKLEAHHRTRIVDIRKQEIIKISAGMREIFKKYRFQMQKKLKPL
jgi:hypothetical protein